MNKINWGIIGLGNIAQNFSEGFNEVKNSNLLAISSLNPLKLEKFKSKFKIDNKYSFDDYEKLINCREVDIVYITLPNSLHYKWILKCIENNKKVLVEKPAFQKLTDAKQIKKKIIEKKLFFSEGFMYRHHPQIHKIIKIINNNEIGELKSMESSFGTNLLTKKKLFIFNKKKKINPNSRLFNKELGGGCILDLGCYPSSFSLFIASQLKKINYENFQIKNIKKEVGETGVEIDAELEINFDDKFLSKVKTSFKKDLGSRSIIHGVKGSILIENTWHGGDVHININSKKQVFFQNIKKNIFSYEIENISNDLLENNNEPSYPGTRINDSVLNTKILDSWINEKK